MSQTQEDNKKCCNKNPSSTAQEMNIKIEPKRVTMKEETEVYFILFLPLSPIHLVTVEDQEEK